MKTKYFNIEDIPKETRFDSFLVGDIKTKGISKASRFEVSFKPFDVDSSVISGDALRNITLRGTSTVLPGMSISTSTYQLNNIIEKSPFQKNYDNININILLSRDMRERDTIQKWIDSIINNDNHTLNYKNEYSTTTVITHFNESGIATYQSDLYESYPVNVSDISMDWANDVPNVVQMSIAYKNSDITKIVLQQ